MSVQEFFTTTCPLSYGGVTLYGTVDVGVGYDKFGAPFNPFFPTGVQELNGKPGKANIYALTPNGLSQSDIGVKVKEDFAPGWSVVAQAEVGFDPYSLELADTSSAMWQNNDKSLPNQNTNADSAPLGPDLNSQVFAGLSNTTLGTLTFGRENTLLLDGVNAYDPMGGSYAFSPLGWSGTTVGTGDTGNSRSNSAFKYRVNYGAFHAAAMAQVGGYAQGNGSTALYQADIGGTLYGFSLDALYSKVDNADNLGTTDTSTSVNGNLTKPASTLVGTVSNNQSGMLLAKYTWNQLQLFGGYEYIQYSNPSFPYSSNKLVYTAVGGVLATSKGDQFYSDKDLQIMWTAAKYAVTHDVDVALAYYHYSQGSYLKSAPSKTSVSCSNSSNSDCSGSLDAVSAMVDWRFYSKFDAYAGIMFSEVNNGLANGYQAGGHVNVAPTAGLRFRF